MGAAPKAPAGIICGPVAGTIGRALTGGLIGLAAMLLGPLATKGRAAAVVCNTGGGGRALAGIPPISDTGMGFASKGGPLRVGGKGTLIGCWVDKSVAC